MGPNSAAGNDDGDRRPTTDGIDVHAHSLPAFYREALTEAGLSRPDGIVELPSDCSRSVSHCQVHMSVLKSLRLPGEILGEEMGTASNNFDGDCRQDGNLRCKSHAFRRSKYD
jgi:hypothetical protein